MRESIGRYTITGRLGEGGMGLVYEAWDDRDEAMSALWRAVDGGYCGLPALEVDPWLDPLRGRHDFRRLLDRAEVHRRAALDTFVVAGGERLLGITMR